MQNSEYDEAIICIWELGEVSRDEGAIQVQLDDLIDRCILSNSMTFRHDQLDHNPNSLFPQLGLKLRFGIGS